jgi:hypothetical protein
MGLSWGREKDLNVIKSTLLNMSGSLELNLMGFLLVLIGLSRERILEILMLFLSACSY